MNQKSMHLSGVRAAVKAHWRSSVALGFALLHAIVFVAVIFSEPPLPPPTDEPCPPLPPGSGCFDIWDAGAGLSLLAMAAAHSVRPNSFQERVERG